MAKLCLSDNFLPEGNLRKFRFRSAILVSENCHNFLILPISSRLAFLLNSKMIFSIALERSVKGAIIVNVGVFLM